MIIIKAPRQQFECVVNNFFQYIKLWKKTQMINVAHYSKGSGEYLTAKLFNSLLDEIELLLKKKLFMSAAKTLTVKLTAAQGIVLFSAMMKIPAEPTDYFFYMVRNNWLQILDKAINHG